MRSRSKRTLIRLMVATAAGTVLVIALGAIAVQMAFSTPKVLPISEANTMSDVVLVTVKGQVYPKGVNRFIIKDKSGAAQLETCPAWFRRIILPTGETVTVTGDVLITPADIPGARYRMAAYVIQQPGEPDIVLRTNLGKPPWADSSYIPRAR